MESISLAEFFYQRIQETIDHIKYVTKVEISYEDGETFGNNYISVTYLVTPGVEYDQLGINNQVKLFNGKGNYTFTLSTRGNSYNDTQHLILKIMEFKNVYGSLSAYAAMQFEKYRSQNFTFEIKSINLWSAANHIEQFLIDTLEKTDDRWSLSIFDIKRSASQWKSLHQLARNSRGIPKEQFSITDIQINNLTKLELSKIRNIILEWEVPIKIVGFKIIESISIHVGKFIEALKAELKENTYLPRIDLYKSLINYLYKKYQPSEEANIIQQQQMEFLQHFIIQNDDIIQLKNKQILMVEAVIIGVDNSIKIKYAGIKTNLEKNRRTKIIEAREVTHVLKNDLYLKYKENIAFKHTSLLKKWMDNQGLEFVYKVFEPDLTK